MQRQGLMPDVISYNAGISACDKGGKWKHALLLLEDLRKKDATPDVTSYSAGISACGKGGKLKGALSLLEDRCKAGITPNSINFNAAISACAKGGKDGTHCRCRCWKTCASSTRCSKALLIASYGLTCVMASLAS